MAHRCQCALEAALRPDQHRQHHQHDGKDGDLPEIGTAAQARQADGPDDVQQHGGEQEGGKDFRHDGPSCHTADNFPSDQRRI